MSSNKTSKVVFLVERSFESGRICLSLTDGHKKLLLAGDTSPETAESLLKYKPSSYDLENLEEAIQSAKKGKSLRFQVYESLPTGLTQLSFDNGGAGGFRLAGPNFNIGRSVLLLQSKVRSTTLGKLEKMVKAMPMPPTKK